MSTKMIKKPIQFPSPSSSNQTRRCLAVSHLDSRMKALVEQVEQNLPPRLQGLAHGEIRETRDLRIKGKGWVLIIDRYLVGNRIC